MGRGRKWTCLMSMSMARLIKIVQLGWKKLHSPKDKRTVHPNPLLSSVRKWLITRFISSDPEGLILKPISPIIKVILKLLLVTPLLISIKLYKFSDEGLLGKSSKLMIIKRNNSSHLKSLNHNQNSLLKLKSKSKS